jgi:hypothetical protein
VDERINGLLDNWVGGVDDGYSLNNPSIH